MPGLPARRGIKVRIARRGIEDKSKLGRVRWVVERTISWLLRFTRLVLQNPLGQVAPDGQRGDIVRVSDGVLKVYLDPEEFDRLDEATLRAMLAEAIPRRTPKPASPGSAPALPKAATPRQPTVTAPARVASAYPVTDTPQVKRRAQSLW